MSELIAQPYLAGGVDCIDLVKMIPSVLKTLRQSTFSLSMQHVQQFQSTPLASAWVIGGLKTSSYSCSWT